jgi:hypothetical protein
MTEERNKAQKSYGGAALLTAVLLMAFPFLLIGIAVFEEVVLNTSNLTGLYRKLGIFAPLDWLLDNTAGRFI